MTLELPSQDDIQDNKPHKDEILNSSIQYGRELIRTLITLFGASLNPYKECNNQIISTFTI